MEDPTNDNHDPEDFLDDAPLVPLSDIPDPDPFGADDTSVSEPNPTSETPSDPVQNSFEEE